MNVDECKEQTQVFDLGNNIRSFLKWNIMDNTFLQVPLIVSLKPGEDAVLIPCKSDYVPQEKLTDYEFALEKDQISWENNYLVVDMLRYSFDNCNFSEPWPVAALFEKLLKDRYDGNIYFKYEFDVKVVPEEIRLRCENVNVVQEWLNGKTLTDRILTKENYINLYDVATFIKQGKNEYVVEVQWHEDEAAYHEYFDLRKFYK